MNCGLKTRLTLKQLFQDRVCSHRTPYHGRLKITPRLSPYLPMLNRETNEHFEIIKLNRIFKNISSHIICFYTKNAHLKRNLYFYHLYLNLISRYKIKRYTRSYGPSHPKAAIVWSNLAVALRGVVGTVFPVCYKWGNLRISSKVCFLLF